MPAVQLGSVIRQFRGAGLLSAAGPGDAELLERFVANRDERAFEALLRRHGPMVLGVCRRVLRNEADAEDAFQATFVVLVRKAHSVVPRSGVGNWLYGVAHKTALKARAMSSRRRARERQARAAPRGAADGTWAPLLDALDEELSALPEKYRSAIVLCDLEGLSYRMAAARLGCPQGTLSGRLTRGRALLARRLARRGLTVPGAAVAPLLAREASACLPPHLLTATLRAGLALAADPGLKTTAVSAQVASLAEGTLKMMLLSKLKSAAVGPLLVALVLTAGWAFAARVSAQATGRDGGPTPRCREDARASAPKARTGGGRADVTEAEFVFLAADGGQGVSLVVAGTSAPVLNLPVTADVRVLAGGRPVGVKGLRPGTRVHVRMGPGNAAVREIRAAGEKHEPLLLRDVRDLELIAPPSEAEVLRALPRDPPGIPYAYEVFRQDFQVVTERQAVKADPPRFYPMIGPARVHHCPWKCTVYYREVIETGYPFLLRTSRPRVRVVYIDRTCLIPVR